MKFGLKGNLNYLRRGHEVPQGLGLSAGRERQAMERSDPLSLTYIQVI